MESDIIAHGASVAVVGNGAPAHAQRFERHAGLQGKVFTDPARQTYRTLGMKSGVATTFNLEAVRNALRAYRAGFRQRRRQGDPWQQGGTAVFDPGGRLVFLHVAKSAGDNVDAGALLAVLSAL